MTGISAADLSGDHLRALQRALTRRGMSSDLDIRAVWPRLRVRSPYEASAPEVADFEGSIVAVSFDDGWWFTWLWAEKISETSNVNSAADLITLELGGPDSQARVRANPLTLVPPLTRRSRGGLNSE
jgi:hypothetical protein